MANVTATTGVDQFTGTGSGGNTGSNSDEILVTAQNQIQAGDLFNGGAGTDMLRLDASLDFTSIINGTNSGIKNIEIIGFNGANTATFRSDQFGAGLLSNSLTLQGTTTDVQTIIINMVSGATTLNMSAWQFNNWTGGTDIISVIGSTAADTILVSSQHTRFDGGAGSDTVDYSTWGGGFTLTLNGSNGVTATWNSGLTDQFRNVENITGSTSADTITGDSFDNRLSGAAGDDTLSGGTGSDTLDGGTGNDTMTGGVGSDTFYVDSTSDLVIELSTEAGTDIVHSSVTFSAAGTNQSGIENITLTGTAAINATGNALANTITGNSGNNVIDGGAGADTMTGGAGNDTYIVDNVGDAVVELNSNTGTDLVLSAVTFSAAGTNRSGIENITLTGTAAINATGNALANTITGNSSNNIINGGTGADTMTGGAGNDTYTVDNGSDAIADLASDTGTDLVNSSVTFSAAGTNQSGIENIALTGTAAINATGNALANTITGNSGNNVIDGGTGADTMTGGAGSDTYYVDNVGDVVIDLSSNTGTDLVYASVTFSAAVTNQPGIENITLTGTDAINATGNALANVITGNAADNVIDGGTGADTLIGGFGGDALTGGTGPDVFAYDARDTSVAQWDVATDFSRVDGDRIQFGSTGPASFEAASKWLIRTDAFGNAILSASWNDNQQRLTLINISEGNLTASDFVFDTSAAPRNVTGSAGMDMIFGGLGNDTLIGGDGINFLIGDAGTDTLIGGKDNDALDGGIGADTMTGGLGNDTYYVDNVSDIVNEAAPDAGRDRIHTTISFAMTGSASGVENGRITGPGNINLTGNDLANALTGNSENNILDGGNGNDSISAGAGADTLIGGAGNDTLTGGTGSDVFAFATGSGADVITDFQRTEDRLDLRAYGIDTAAELIPFASNQGANLILNFETGNSILINTMQVAQIHDGMLIV